MSRKTDRLTDRVIERNNEKHKYSLLTECYMSDCVQECPHLKLTIRCWMNRYCIFVHAYIYWIYRIECNLLPISLCCIADAALYFLLKSLFAFRFSLSAKKTLKKISSTLLLVVSVGKCDCTPRKYLHNDIKSKNIRPFVERC